MMRGSIALILTALTACGSSAPVPASTSNRSTAPARAPALDDLLGFLPGNSQLVIVIDVQALRTSELWKSRQDKIGALIDAKLASVVAACGFNPLEDLETIAVGLQTSSKMGVFVMRGFERDRTIRCLETYGLPDTTVTNDKGVLTLANKSGAVNLVTFVDPRTLVMVGSAGPTVATLRAATETDRPLRASREFMATFEPLDRTTVMSVVLLPTFLDALAAMEPRPVAMTSTLDVTDEIEFRLRIAYASATDAQAAATALAPRMEAYSELFYVATLEPVDTAIEGHFKMDPEMFDQVWSFAATAFAAGFSGT